MKISLIKPWHAKWVTKFYDYIRSKPEIVRKGWEKSLITEHVHKKIELDPFVSLNTSTIHPSPPEWSSEFSLRRGWGGGGNYSMFEFYPFLPRVNPRDSPFCSNIFQDFSIQII